MIYTSNNVTEQPSHLVRWWIRHHRSIGLASMAGSAVLMCIIAVILLPIIVHHLSKGFQMMDKTNDILVILEEKFCGNITDPTIDSINNSIRVSS